MTKASLGGGRHRQALVSGGGTDESARCPTAGSRDPVGLLVCKAKNGARAGSPRRRIPTPSPRADPIKRGRDGRFAMSCLAHPPVPATLRG